MLLLLLACGNREAPAPTPEPPIEPPPRCKPGKTICAGDEVRMCEDGK